jgi:hypothetical protein
MSRSPHTKVRTSDAVVLDYENKWGESEIQDIISTVSSSCCELSDLPRTQNPPKDLNRETEEPDTKKAFPIYLVGNRLKYNHKVPNYADSVLLDRCAATYEPFWRIDAGNQGLDRSW